jgi:hypothetical protein
MATIRGYISAKLERYHIDLSDAELDAILADNNLVGTDTYSSAASTSVKLAFVKCIPELLLQPDIAEGGFSRKFDKAAIMTYYSMLCKELGVEDQLNPKPKLKNASNRW